MSLIIAIIRNDPLWICVSAAICGVESTPGGLAETLWFSHVAQRLKKRRYFKMRR